MMDLNTSGSSFVNQFQDSMFSTETWGTTVRPAPHMSGRRKRYRTANDASASEQLSPLTPRADGDVAILDRAQAQAAEINADRAKRKLVALLVKFHDLGYSSVANRENKVSKQSLEVAAALIQLLPASVPLPKVLPDGENGVIFAWVRNGRKVFLTIDGYTVHGIDKAGTPDAVYLDNMRFREDRIPPAILAALTS